REIGIVRSGHNEGGSAGTPVQGILAPARRGSRVRASDPRLRRLEAVLDLDRFYSFLALEIMTCHFDGYARGINNYWVYSESGAERSEDRSQRTEDRRQTEIRNQKSASTQP